MTSREFAYWLQGFFEISGSEDLSKSQVEMIKKHLNMVFVHEIDPSYPDADKLQQIHDGVKKLEGRVEALEVDGVDKKLTQPGLPAHMTKAKNWDGTMRC
jgi:uncharacterized protein YfkK (UPF0435 family)